MDYPDLLEEAVRCRILWMMVERPELRDLIGNGPRQVPLERLVDLIVNGWCIERDE